MQAGSARQAEMVLPDRVVSRVLSKAVPFGNCLLSTYSPVTKRGYRQVGWSEKGRIFKMLAHRVIWVARHGPIPSQMTVHHRCFQTACVNIAHLELMERFENTRRSDGQNWPVGSCKRGHPNTELVREGRQRVCRLCRQASVVRRRKERQQRANSG